MLIKGKRVSALIGKAGLKFGRKTEIPTIPTKKIKGRNKGKNTQSIDSTEFIYTIPTIPT